MLVEDIGIYKSCSFVELIFLFIINLVLTTLSIVGLISLLMPFISIGIAIVASFISSILLLRFTAGLYQDKKRNLPERFHIKKVALLLNNLFGLGMQKTKRYSYFSHYTE